MYISQDKLMNKITSAQNPLIKQIKKLGTSKKYREIEGKLILDGIHVVEEFLLHTTNHSPLTTLILSESFLSHAEYHKFKLLESQSIIVPDDLLTKITPTKTPEGILAIIPHPQSFNPSNSQSPPKKAILLDNLQDPGNIGTIIRTAVAAGYNTIYTYNGADIWSPKTLRASQGAHFHFSLQIISLPQPFNLSIPLYGLSLSSESQNFFETELPSSHILAFGNEGQGLSPEIIENCQKLLHIPMQNEFESLNVGIAAGICMFHQ